MTYAIVAAVAILCASAVVCLLTTKSRNHERALLATSVGAMDEEDDLVADILRAVGRVDRADAQDIARAVEIIRPRTREDGSGGDKVAQVLFDMQRHGLVVRARGGWWSLTTEGRESLLQLPPLGPRQGPWS